MCAIAGEADLSNPSEEIVRKMISLMSHRGPDEQKIWSSPRCILAHARLRIIDLTPAGSQPMQNADGSAVVAFNGEIFNFRELRSMLESEGFHFQSHSDTEVLLHGYKAWGEKLPEKLLGMFAFALWDATAQKLLLARDTFGKKPLFYRTCGSSLSFASELDALLADTTAKISPANFASYLRFGYTHGTTTAIEGIQRLAPGELLVWENGTTRSRRFQTRFTANTQSSDTLSELDQILHQAVESRLVSDVPLGCFLSGGIDSSLVASIASQIQGPGLRTFTVSFPGTPRDEAAFASTIASRLKTNHTTISISSVEMCSHYLETLRRCPEPLGDDSFIPTYFISRAAREHVTVALSGDGGDELFGGYPKYRQIALAAKAHPFAKFIPHAALQALPDRAAKALEVFKKNTESDRALWLSSLWKSDELPDILKNPADANPGREFFFAEWNSKNASSLQDRFSQTDLSTYLEGSILTKVDRAAMACGLEVRSPLLDERILDFTARHRIRDTRLGQGKTALRTLLHRHLPPELFAGPKRGFGLPIDEWFRGPLREILEEYTSPARLNQTGLLDPKAVARFRNLHLSGHRNYGRKLHAIVAWEVWREKNTLD
jgi:asparagine synthase (glutamine-hydrolysing)